MGRKVELAAADKNYRSQPILGERDGRERVAKTMQYYGCVCVRERERLVRKEREYDKFIFGGQTFTRGRLHVRQRKHIPTV